MDLHSGLPFWLVKSGLPYNYLPLQQDIKTGVLVLGGGISGALMARQLNEAGIDCVVLDARTIGLGSTVASTALLQYEIDVSLSELKEKIGIDHAARAYHLCNDSITTLQKISRKLSRDNFETKDSVYFAAAKKDVKFLQQEFTIRKEQGFKVTYLDAGELKDQYGFDAPAAIVSKHGAQVNAYLFTHQLLQNCITRGVKVYDRTAAVKINHRANGVEIKTAEGFTVKAKKLVYATGFESVKYIDKKVADLHCTYAIVSENMQAETAFWKKEALIWNTADPYLYMRTTADKRIICGGRDEEFYNPARRDKLLKSKTRQLANDFSKLFPDIPFKTEFSWTGVFAATKDGLPYIDTYKKLPNSYFALGFGGNGITFSQIAAEIITDMITGKKNKDAAIFSFNR
ncbi:MAG: FAD-binding oxidoreductase [Rhizobacter sp.]|nr:FAD-binding oxidoreductase [Ferruginibacter sp.]